MFEDKTISSLRRGLDVSSYRQELLSQNIANADTPGYQRMDVSFAEALNDAENRLPMTRTNSAHLGTQGENPAIQVSRTSAAVRADGNTVVIETEMARLSQNAMYYQALSTQLSKHIALLKDAISGRG